MSNLRRIQPLMVDYSSTPDVLQEKTPELIWVNPKELLVNEKYQRRLNQKSLEMIKTIVSNFSWSKYKPPVVTKTSLGYEIIDGQHTAIACASHPYINNIPVFVVETSSIEERANSFIGHNTTRIIVPPMQIFFSGIAAGNEEAIQIASVCDKSNITIRHYPPSNGNYGINETVAINAIASLIKRRGPFGARQVLTIISNAKVLAPIAAAHIRAIEFLLYDPNYHDKVNYQNLTTAIITASDEAERQSKSKTYLTRTPQWKIMALAYFIKHKEYLTQKKGISR